MTTYNLFVGDITVSQIKSQTKVIEGRLLKSFFVDIKENDYIIFNNMIKKKVKYIAVYKSFKEMLSNEGLSRVLPNIDNINDGVMKYNNIYKKQINNYKILAICLD